MSERDMHAKYKPPPPQDYRTADPALSPVSWGTNVIDPADRIDVTKPHRTRSGKRVICMELVLYGDQGQEYTYPVKGTIVDREAKPGSREKLRYAIWSLDGRADVVFGHHREDDLIPEISPT